MTEARESFDEINALIDSVSKAMEMDHSDVIMAIEQGDMGMEMQIDEKGQNYLLIRHQDRIAHIYQGAIFRPTSAE